MNTTQPAHQFDNDMSPIVFAMVDYADFSTFSKKFAYANFTTQPAHQFDNDMSPIVFAMVDYADFSTFSIFFLNSEISKNLHMQIFVSPIKNRYLDQYRSDRSETGIGLLAMVDYIPLRGQNCSNCSTQSPTVWGKSTNQSIS